LTDANDAAAFDAAQANAAAVAAVEAMLATTPVPVSTTDGAPQPVPTTTSAPAPAEPPAPVPALSAPIEADLARRMADVARVEAEAVRQRAEAKAELEAVRAEAERLKAEHEALERELAENPLSVLEKRKWTLESLVQSAATLATPEAVRIARVEAELKATKAEVAAREAAAREADAARAKAEAQATLKTQLIPTQIATIKDELPYLHAWFDPAQLSEAVYGIMGQRFLETKGAATVEPVEAARQLEKALRERVQRLPGASVTPPTPAAASITPTVKPSVTVTNATTQAAPNTSAPDPYNREALDARAMAELAAAMNQRA
jgi:hypothetical protein